MPSWVNIAWQEYAKRIPSDFQLILKEVKAEPRSQGKTPKQIMSLEATRLLNVTPQNSYTVALDEKGKDISTRELANMLDRCRLETQNIVFYIGGPDGLDHQLKNNAATKIKLSHLTMPHPLVRVLLAEQLYRAWSILANHPYHRT